MLSKYSFLYIVYYVYSIIIILLTLCIMRWMSNLGSDADQYICQHFQLNNLPALKCNVDHFDENILTERERINHLKKEFHKIISYLTISLYTINYALGYVWMASIMVMMAFLAAKSIFRVIFNLSLAVNILINVEHWVCILSGCRTQIWKRIVETLPQPNWMQGKV